MFDESGSPGEAIDNFSAHLQQTYWTGTPQGSDVWHNLRAWRVTASRFGSAMGCDKFSSAKDLLRGTLWPVRSCSLATIYGTTNEKVSLSRMLDWVAREEKDQHPVLIDEPGCWVPSEYPYLAGSPDGVYYEVVTAATADAFLCRRVLIEIKTPWKLRNRKTGEKFYPQETHCSGVVNTVPATYYAQIQGNMHLMGMQYCLFMVLSPSGYQISEVPYDATFCERFLMPSLITNWETLVRPSIEKMLSDPNVVQFGDLPLIKRAHDHTHTT